MAMAVVVDVSASSLFRRTMGEELDAARTVMAREAKTETGARILRNVAGVPECLATIMVAALTDEQIDQLVDALAKRAMELGASRA